MNSVKESLKLLFLIVKYFIFLGCALMDFHQSFLNIHVSKILNCFTNDFILLSFCSIDVVKSLFYCHWAWLLRNFVGWFGSWNHISNLLFSLCKDIEFTLLIVKSLGTWLILVLSLSKLGTIHFNVFFIRSVHSVWWNSSPSCTKLSSHLIIKLFFLIKNTLSFLKHKSALLSQSIKIL